VAGKAHRAAPEGAQALDMRIRSQRFRAGLKKFRTACGGAESCHQVSDFP